MLVAIISEPLATACPTSVSLNSCLNSFAPLNASPSPLYARPAVAAAATIKGINVSTFSKSCP